ncbi:hypothetical protein BDF19DRAFT_428400 [Syncephalis fuscata]|nr:hypothetical protein BDF19DRAFT_428400 [Syncephalis fuscata]
MRYIAPLLIVGLLGSLVSAGNTDYGKKDTDKYGESSEGSNSYERPCPRIRSDCGGCPKGKKCVYSPGSKNKCPSAKCMPDKEPQCIACPQIFKECPQCAYGTECVRTQQTCTSCADVSCQAITTPPTKPPTKPPTTPHCVQCFVGEGVCPPSCPENTECVKHPATCEKCAYATCEKCAYGICKNGY